MILRRPILALKTPVTTTCHCLRFASSRLLSRPIPPPTPFVPNVETFLKLIGRQLSQHTSKIPSWDALFTLSSTELRELGVEPPRSRKYLLRWRERFRQGKYGIGGDLEHVQDGVGEVKIFEVPIPKAWKSLNPSAEMATATRTAGMRKVALNVPIGAEKPAVAPEKAKVIDHIKVRGKNGIEGPHVLMIKGTAGTKARIVVKEGLWEERRGHKVDGGERRKAEVRSKRRAEARKQAAR
ncbi:hypothetical protein EG328_005534 [Venturia inaequalis]|uniref:Small ribosomal subunit protein mS41 n=1 Tax=Venturia inaequalis TaxID=5025 RepID=A0A8H3VXN3_VENIN|nr:hypothetical protein EG328_005534 [Venturia inaequalis]KAE9994669.1 hypothetical protein EG327_005115 [Venturia inaequalis]